MLDKGNEFLKIKNYLAAISAYSTGIKFAKDPAILLLQRATAHFAIENYNRCVSVNRLIRRIPSKSHYFQAVDTSKAFDLLNPPVASNLKERVLCLTLRGSSLIQLGFLKQGHSELSAALKLDPSSFSLQEDIKSDETELRKQFAK